MATLTQHATNADMASTRRDAARTMVRGTRAERALASSWDRGFMAYVNGDDAARRELLRVANVHYRNFRADSGMARATAPVLTAPESQPKLNKSYTASFGIMFVPERGVAGFNLCPMASAGCAAVCLGPHSGKGELASVQHARMVRTRFALANPHSFAIKVAHELHMAHRKYGRVLFRPNTTSDIRWEIVAPDMLAWIGATSWITAYDYTAWKYGTRDVPTHYHLTYSHKEDRPLSEIRRIVRAGGSVAVAVRLPKSAPAPGTWNGLPVVDGDTTDDRSQDGASIVILRPKGSAAQHDTSGFVVDMSERF